MTTITCTRRLTFEAGHRVYGHESKCANLHGHSYKVEIRAQMVRLETTDGTKVGAQVDGIGRVIDFSVLKERVGGWIDRYWDHAFIYYEKDLNLASIFKNPHGEGFGTKSFAFAANPTAENLAEFILRYLCPDVLAGTGVEVTHVKVWETENCYAEASL